MLTELIPLAAVITFSPLSIIPAVLVLHSGKARPAALMYLLGWVVALTAITPIFLELSDLVGNLDKPPTWASWLRVVVGAALIVFGTFRWLTRKRSAHMPKWMQQLTGVTPRKAGIYGALL